MSWIALALVSALFLGLYDLCKKHAVHANAVLPVLFLGCVVAAFVWAAAMAVQVAAPGLLPPALVVEPLGVAQHACIFAKSAIVAASWTCSYFAVKHLPVSLAAPIRATGPLWTLLGALLVLGERPNALEGAGIATTLASFVGLSVAGRREGVHFMRDRWVGFMLAGTLLGAASALYDKFLLGQAGFTASTVQAWFSFYLVVLFLPLVVGWKRRWWPRGEFHWRWTIPCIGLALLVADWVYFSALRDPEALIALVSSIRRASTLVAFAGGLVLFKEGNGWRKLPAVLGVVAGVALTALG
jgi:drug/metabolite transporter (DMT)-like permease